MHLSKVEIQSCKDISAGQTYCQCIDACLIVQLEDLEQTNSDLEDANTQLEGKALQAGRQRDELQQQLQEASSANQADIDQLRTSLQEQQASSERLMAQVQKLEAACSTLKVSNGCLVGGCHAVSVTSCNDTVACSKPARMLLSRSRAT